jgi:LptD protein
VRQPTYVLTCLIWLLCCPVSTAHTASTRIPTGLVIAKLQDSTTTDHLPQHRVTSSEAADALQTSNTAPDAPTSPALASSESDSATQDPGAIAPESPIQSIIQYDAKDAIIFDVKRQTIHLYGAGIIEHGTIKLEAEEVSLDWINHTIAALSTKNEAGEIGKKAVFTKDGVEYFAESIRYNFQSQRATANKLFTKQDDGILRANRLKKDRETTFYADRATYTTCDLAHPHFHVDVRKLKITQDDRVVSGPFNFYFDGVPTLLGLPFGIFYLPRESGIIPPKYGGESKKGFCLQDGGYYIKFSDYANLALQGSIYSKGATEFTAASNYKKRYRYVGSLHFERQVDVSTQEIKKPKEKSWRFQWKHDTENNRRSSWHAQIDLAGTNARKDSLKIEDYKTKKDSSIRYTNHLVGFPLPYTLTSSVRLHTVHNGEADASLPEVLLNTENMYPFRKRGIAGTSWPSNIYLQHKLEFHNKLSNSVDHTLDFLEPKAWPALWKSRNQGVQNTVLLQTNIKILNYLNLAPKITYREQWYWEKIDYKYDAKGALQEDKVPGFVRVYDYNVGATLKTNLYGTHIFGHNAAVQAIRHQFRPELAFTYTPDFSGPEYGYWQTMEGGQKLNRFKGAVYPSPGKNETAVLAVSLNNRLDMKVKSSKDAKTGTKKVPILESCDWSTSYDFLADQYALSDIKFKAQTRLLDQMFNINFESSFDPYFYKSTKNLDSPTKQKFVRSNELAWNHGKGLGHMNNAMLSIGAKLGTTSKKSTVDLDEDSKLQNALGAQATPKHLQEDAEQYKAFSIPWELGLNYHWNYTRPTPEDDAKKKNSLGFEWCMDLTEKWKVTFKSTYDLTNSEFVGNATNIVIHRDLHCWEMDFQWNPLGDQQKYKFSVGLKAPLLKDLKYSRDREYDKH